MSIESTAATESFQSQGVSTVTVSPWQVIYWSIRREFWEYRSIYLVPPIAAALGVIGFVLGLGHRASINPPEPPTQHSLLQPYMMVAGLCMVAAMFVAVFYCLDTLNGENRDRSILFWKSMPVSDLTAVLAKASIPLLILPLISVLSIFVAHLLMLLISLPFWSASTLGLGAAWKQVSFLHMSALVLYHLVIVHGLWHAPFYAWMLMVSAWAKRAPLLWAFLPPAALAIFEKIAFNSMHFVNLLGYQLTGGGDMASSTAAESTPVDMLGHFDLLEMFTTPGLWPGLLIAALFLYLAARFRRSRGPF